MSDRLGGLKALVVRIAMRTIRCGFLALLCVYSLIHSFSNVNSSHAAEPESLPVLGLHQTKDIKIIFHSNTNLEKAGLNKGVYYVRYLLDHYKRLNVPSSAIKMSVVFYGDGVLPLLSEQSERLGKKAKKNRNAAVLQELMSQGVSIEACGETMAIRRIAKEDLLPGVRVVEGSYVRAVDLQLQGYAYLKM